MDLIKLEIHGISYSENLSGAFALVLNESKGIRKLPVVIGGFEAQAIALALQKNIKTSRPLTHELFKGFADKFEIKISDLKSKKRSRNISLPRQIAMYLCRTHTKLSLPEIGRQFGGKDHTTVIFANKKISELINKDNELKKIVNIIINNIESGKTLKKI